MTKTKNDLSADYWKAIDIAYALYIDHVDSKIEFEEFEAKVIAGTLTY